MSMFDRFVRQLEVRGLTVAPGELPDQLLLRGPAKEMTPEIVEAVKMFKPQLLERFGRREPSRRAATPGGEADADPSPRRTLDSPPARKAADAGRRTCEGCKAVISPDMTADDAAVICPMQKCVAFPGAKEDQARLADMMARSEWEKREAVREAAPPIPLLPAQKATEPAGAEMFGGG